MVAGKGLNPRPLLVSCGKSYRSFVNSSRLRPAWRKRARQGTFGDLLVIWNRQASDWRGWVAQDDVASRLMVNSVTNLLQRSAECLA